MRDNSDTVIHPIHMQNNVLKNTCTSFASTLPPSCKYGVVKYQAYDLASEMETKLLTVQAAQKVYKYKAAIRNVYQIHEIL